MKAARITIFALFAILCLAIQPVHADPTRIIEQVRTFGYWSAGIGNEQMVSPNGTLGKSRYAFLSTELMSPQTGPMHVEILLQPNGVIGLMLNTPNMSGRNFANIGAIDATLIVGNHTARLVGQAARWSISSTTPCRFHGNFKWVKSVPVFSLQFPLGRIDISTAGLNDAMRYAFKLRKSLK